MIIETPQGTWTPKVTLDHDAADQSRDQSRAQSACPHEKVAKMVAHSTEPPSDAENYEAPGGRLFDNPVLYDNIFGWDASEELDFITSTTNADRLVEFGCGSGRVLLPLLERGYEVDGIDSSSDALIHLSEAAAERKTKHTPRLILGDLTEVALLPTYPGAFSALNTVRCLPTPELVAAHLRRAAMSVTTGGKYLIHLDSFGTDLTERPQPGEYGDWEGFGDPAENPEYQNITVRWELAKREPATATTSKLNGYGSGTVTNSSSMNSCFSSPCRSRAGTISSPPRGCGRCTASSTKTSSNRSMRNNSGRPKAATTGSFWNAQTAQSHRSTAPKHSA